MLKFKEMKKNVINKYTLVGLIALIATSCTKMEDVGILNAGNYPDTASTVLKDITDIKMGVAVDYTDMTGNATYSGIAKKEFDAITMGYSMKHGAIVKADGSLNFTNADAIINAASGMEVFGHTLGWHSNQNAGYLKSFAGITVPAASELLTNPGFESGQGDWGTWNTQNGATVSFLTDGANAHAGGGYMKVVNPVANSGGQWKVQVASPTATTEIGKSYVISYWVKAASAGGSIRLSTNGGNAQYQGDQTINTTWQQVSFTFTASATATKAMFDMGLLANTYYIDDVSFKEVVQAPSGAQVTAKVDQALNSFITGTVNHFKGKVKEWDVVNEVLSPSGALRLSGNSSDITDKNASDIFFWSDYLGRNFPLKAFQYAAAADPSATLFINEYGLEASRTKTDSLVALVKELKSRGAKIDGIGTQLHVSWNTSYTLIDSMFIKLAGTGLKVRVSEFDVRINPLFKAGFVLIDLEETYQAEMYHYVISSYLKYVPAAQRAGITIWGIADHTSWLYNGGKDFPLPWNVNYGKKKAYAAIAKALQGK